MRFPSVVGAMLASALLVVLARKLFDRRIALLSGLFLATSPYFVKWSQQARVYPLLAAASLVATLLLLRAFERESRAAWALYGLAYAGLLVTHAAVGLLLLPAHAVLIVQRRDRFLPHGLMAGLVIAAVGVPWVAQLAMRTDSATSETAWIPFPSAETVARATLGVSGIAGLGILLAVVGLWVLHRAGKSDLAVWLATWAFGPILLALVISIARPIFLDRYLVTTAPAFAMLAAVAVDGRRRTASCRSCRRSRCGDRDRARVVVLDGRRRELAWGGLAKRRRDDHGATRRCRGRRRSLVGARRGGVLRRPRQRRLDSGFDLGSPLVGGRPGASGRPPASARLR